MISQPITFAIYSNLENQKDTDDYSCQYQMRRRKGGELHWLIWAHLSACLGLPRWHSGRESACQCRRCKRCGFDPWVGKIPWRRKWQLTAVLPGKFHGQRNLAGYSPWGCTESDMTEQLSMHRGTQFVRVVSRICWDLIKNQVLSPPCLLPAPLSLQRPHHWNSQSQKGCHDRAPSSAANSLVQILSWTHSTRPVWVTAEKTSLSTDLVCFRFSLSFL